MSVIQKIKGWLGDAAKISEVRSNFKEATSSANIDKHKLGFCADSRFKSFSANIYFGGYTGSYGDSSVYNFLKIEDSSIAEEALINYCQEREAEILEFIANAYKKKALELKDDAMAEAEGTIELLDSLQNF